jgi:hypothetical protein
LPYSRNLFCPSAFAAAQAISDVVAAKLGPGPDGHTLPQPQGVLLYYQTLPDRDPDALAAPDDVSQTAAACLNTAAPYAGGPSPVHGAGSALCHLLSYVTSPGPLPAGAPVNASNPVAHTLRQFPGYFRHLLHPPSNTHTPFALNHFKHHSAYDALVRGLGFDAVPGFELDYHNFSPSKVYTRDHWLNDSRYNGISGGGGGGWGGQIVLSRHDGTPDRTLFAFGGGGGGGLTSTRHPPATRLGGGGGGGAQFANGYRFGGKSYNGLGLGAGVGDTDAAVQYSYNDYEGSSRPPVPVHTFNAGVVAHYMQQTHNLDAQLRQAYYVEGAAIVVTGGGGQGAGFEYLRRNGDEYLPHALSTQAGFQFTFTFQLHPHTLDDDDDITGGVRRRRMDSISDAPHYIASETQEEIRALAAASSELEQLYQHLGDYYRVANKQALAACGGDNTDYPCICPKAAAIVICLALRAQRDIHLPAWLQEAHCPPPSGSASNSSSGTTTQPPGSGHGFTEAQVVLLQAAQQLNDQQCGAGMRKFFNRLNSSA